MKFCSACGFEMPDDSTFCPNCGVRQTERKETIQDNEGTLSDSNYAAESVVSDVTEEPKTPEKKFKIPKWAYIACGAVAAIALLLVLVFTGVFSGLLPHSKLKLKYAESSLLKKFTDTVCSEVDNVKDIDMAYELTMNAVKPSSGRDSGETAEMLNKLTVSGGVELNNNSQKASVVAEYKRNELIDLRYFLEKDKLSLYLSPISDELYTCSITELLKKVSEDGDFDLGNDFDELKNEKQAKKDLEKLKKIVFKHVFDSDIKITKGKTVRLFDGEETVKGAAVYQISLSEKEWKALLNDLVDCIDDKDSYIYSTIDVFVQRMKQSYSYMNYEDASDVIEELRDNIPEYAEKIADLGVKLEVAMKGNQIISQRLYNDEGDLCYEAMRSGNDLHFDVMVNDNVVFDFQGTKDGRHTEFDANVYIDGDKIRITGSDINLNKRSQLGIPQGEYVLNYDEYKVMLNVESEGKGVMHELRIRFDKNDRYRSFDSLTISLYTERGASISKPKGAEVVDLNDYTMEELQKLVSDLQMQFYQNVLKKLN